MFASDLSVLTDQVHSCKVCQLVMPISDLVDVLINTLLSSILRRKNPKMDIHHSGNGPALLCMCWHRMPIVVETLAACREFLPNEAVHIQLCHTRITAGEDVAVLSLHTNACATSHSYSQYLGELEIG